MSDCSTSGSVLSGRIPRVCALKRGLGRNISWMIAALVRQIVEEFRMNRLEPLLALRAQDFRRFILIERENRHGNEKKIGNRMVGVGKQTPHFAQRRFVLRRTNQPEHALKVEVGV